MSIWTARRARALALAAQMPHAAEILRCYASVTEAQARAVERVTLREVTSAASGADAEPLLNLSRLPLNLLLPAFDDFLGDLAEVGPEPMVAEAARWRTRSPGERSAALMAALSTDDHGADAHTFHPRAFAQAVATALAGRVLPTTDAADADAQTRCRACGAPPLVATLRDLPSALGSRGLVCGRCGSERRARRLTCVYCGESRADRLRVHTVETVAHIRVDECSTCRRYLKTVDLRRRGDAVPLVDELATPELDLWAREQGLTKGSLNLFGL